MIEDFLVRIFFNQWAILGIVSLLLLALAETGRRFGLVSRQRDPESVSSHSGSVQGAVLGLLGLLLGFSFAMAVGRLDARRSLIVDEANAIGTTWLRAAFLPPPHDAEVRSLLRSYTELRLEATRVSTDKEAITRFQPQITEIHNRLWAHAVAAVEAKPTPITMGFVSSLNEMIDIDSSRKAAMRNHVPGAVWLLMLVVAGCGAWASGYGSGAGGLRSLFNQIVFPVLIAVVITLIADIDRPRQGLINMSQQPLIDLLQSMQP